VKEISFTKVKIFRRELRKIKGLGDFHQSESFHFGEKALQNAKGDQVSTDRLENW
jgi:hypothetical protein